MAGMGNRLIQNDLGVDYEIFWDAVKNKAPALRVDLERIVGLESLSESSDTGWKLRSIRPIGSTDVGQYSSSAPFPTATFPNLHNGPSVRAARPTLRTGRKLAMR